MKHITKEDALRALEEAVAEKGEDYIYQYTDSDDWRSYTCTYVRAGEPDCMIGNALHRLGVPLDAFAPHEEKAFDRIADDVAPGIEEEAVRALRAAQSVQDQGRTWGEALRAAREVAPDA